MTQAGVGISARPSVGSRAAGGSRERVFVAVVVIAYVIVASYATAVHEMWRDELHCWLVARDSATPWQVVRERAYDGQPPLWYLLLWVLTRFTWHPELMRVVHLAIATSTVAVVARFAPFGRVARALFAGGYFVAYEYAAFSRCYSLALLFALLLCRNHSRRYERPLVTGGLLAAMALTTTVATLVATAYTGALLIDGLFQAGLPEDDSDEDTPIALAWWRLGVPVSLSAAGIVAAAACAWPPADSTVAHIGTAPEMPWDFAYTRVVAALSPVPPATFFFWNSNAILDAIPWASARFALAAALFGWALFVVSRRRFTTIFFGLAVVLLVGLFKGVYSGSVRHHGFIFVAFLMSAWIAWDDRARRHEVFSIGWRGLRERALAPTLLGVLLAQLPGAVIAITYDARYIFSSGKRAADELRARGLDSALLVAEFDFPAIAVLGQLGPHSFAYSPRTGRPFTFVKWTRDRLWEPTDEETLRVTRELGRIKAQDPVLIMNRPLLPELVDGDRVVRLAEKYDSMIEEENFYLYRVRRAEGLPLH